MRTTSLIAPLSVFAAVSLFAALPARAQEEASPDHARVTLTASAGEHASAHKLEWHALALPGGAVRLLLRVPLEAFQSNATPGFDASLRESFDANRHPYLELEGLVRAGEGASTWSGVYRVAGQTRPLNVSLKLAHEGAQLSLHTSLPLDLDELGLERPKANGEKIEKELALELAAWVTLDPQALVSGGFISPARD